MDEIRRPETFAGKKTVSNKPKLWYKKYVLYDEIQALTDIEPLPICVMDDAAIITNETLKHSVNEILDFTGEGFTSGNHGHHASGIIADRLYGLFPNAKIGFYKVLRSESGTGRSVWIANAIKTAFNSGYQIINASLGSDLPSQEIYSVLESIQFNHKNGFCKKVKKLFGKKYTEKPVYYVCAAGNDSKDTDYPAAYNLPYVISVGAAELDNDELKIAWYSSKGRITFVAPGSDILSCITNNEYQYMSGTSMATPFISGMIAQALAIDPNLTIDKFHQIADMSCVSIDSNNNADGNGFVNIHTFIENVIKMK